MNRNHLIKLGGSIILLLLVASNGFSYENMFHKKESAKLNYDSLFKEASPLNESTEGHQIVELCFQKYGGRDKLEGLNSMFLSYKMKSLHGADSVDISKYWEKDRKYKIIRTDPKRAECRILNGQESWFQNSDTTIELNSGRYKAELFSYLTLSMPLAIETERFDEIRYGTRENETLHFIYMKKNDSLMIIIGIDPHQFHIVSSEGVIYQEDQTFIFVNLFSDYKVVDGYLLPHRLKNISMGLEVGNSIINSLETNKKYEASEFKPGKLPKPSNLY